MICAIVLAAGRSRRMGTQKLLLPIGDKPMIARIIAELPPRLCHKIFVVTGPDGEAVQRALAGPDIEFVANPDPESDMFASIRCGLRAVPRECSAVLIVLGDQPDVSTKLITRLLHRQSRDKSGIVVPVCKKHRGHPVLISTRFRQELLTQHDGVGLRGFLDAHPDEISRVEVADAAILADMDSPADYQHYLDSTRQAAE